MIKELTSVLVNNFDKEVRIEQEDCCFKVLEITEIVIIKNKVVVRCKSKDYSMEDEANKLMEY